MIYILLILIIIAYIINLYDNEHFMPMDTFETRMPHLVGQRYSYNDTPTIYHDSIIYPYAKLSELPINYDPSLL